MCRSLNPDVTVFSNGPVHTDADTRATLAKLRAAGVKIDERRIKRLINNGVGPENGITLEFEIGPPVRENIIFHKSEKPVLIDIPLLIDYSGNADAQTTDA